VHLTAFAPPGFFSSSTEFSSLASGGAAAGDPERAKTIDVSREGLRLVLDAPRDPFSLVALQIFLKGGQEPIRSLGEGRWVRGGQGGQSQEAGLEFVAMQAQERERWVEEIYAGR